MKLNDFTQALVESYLSTEEPEVLTESASEYDDRYWGDYYDELNESLEESAELTESACTRLADTDAQEQTIKVIERAARSAGANLSPGTKIGKYPQTVILDKKHQDNFVRVHANGSFKINGKAFGDWKDDGFAIEDIPMEDIKACFKKVNEALNEDAGNYKDWELYKDPQQGYMLCYYTDYPEGDDGVYIHLPGKEYSTYHVEFIKDEDTVEELAKDFKDLDEAKEYALKVLEDNFLHEAKDLSKVSNSITHLLSDNVEALNACATRDELIGTVQGLLDENGVDTEASRRLMLNMNKTKNLKAALQVVWNFILKGSGEGVI